MKPCSSFDLDKVVYFIYFWEMFSKEEAFKIRTKFWTAFGQYMKLHLSSEGEAVNWVNYKTGIKDLFFKTDVTNKKAIIKIEMASKDLDMQGLMFEQFEEFQPLFESYFNEEWVWLRHHYDEMGRNISTISLELENVSLFRESDWPNIITFLKENLIKLDEFWNDVKDSFEIFK